MIQGNYLRRNFIIIRTGLEVFGRWEIRNRGMLRHDEAKQTRGTYGPQKHTHPNASWGYKERRHLTNLYCSECVFSLFSVVCLNKKQKNTLRDSNGGGYRFLNCSSPGNNVKCNPILLVVRSDAQLNVFSVWPLNPKKQDLFRSRSIWFWSYIYTQENFMVDDSIFFLFFFFFSRMTLSAVFGSRS